MRDTFRVPAMMASPLAAPSSRASTPTPPPGKTIDDLTTALETFSRAHTPDPQIACCCGREECEATQAWRAHAAKLESRLVLSAEVGQALLERHEAYVRRKDAALSRPTSSIFSFPDEYENGSQQHVEYLTKKLDTVTEENTLMETRLNELMIKHEMADASSRTVMRELQDARSTIGRLSAQTARSAGWELRLAQMTQERDDIRQERDSEAHRARHAESKAAAFVDKCAKLQNEVYALREEVHHFRASRADFSKNVLHEARARLEALQHSLGRDQTREDPETTRVLESLVADNETLKRDIAELQNLLVESRDDVRTLREELEDHRAAGLSGPDDLTKVGTPPPSVLYIPRSPAQGRPRGHNHTNSSSSMLFGLPHAPNVFAPAPRTPVQTRNHRRSLSGGARLLGDDAIAEWRNAHDDTLLSPLRPRSPADSLHADAAKYSTSHDADVSPRSSVKPLLLLTRTRGVQTDPHINYVYPSPRPSTLTVERDRDKDGDSSPSTPDTSSTSLAPPEVAALLERVSALLTRMTQADVKTLSTRLKRQHLGSGDVGHLARSTVRSIVSEVTALRAGSTGAEGRALLKFCRDVFVELGKLRGQLNEVVLDPGEAQRLRKEAFDGDEVRPTSAMGGWIAPIQKLFANSSASAGVSTSTGVESAGSGKPPTDLGRGRPSARVVPKLAPAISATSTTVNVEFASTGVRKTKTDAQLQRVSSPPLHQPVPVPHASPSTSRHLMGIFAGAPQSFTNPAPVSTGEGWVILPRNRQVKAAASTAALRSPRSTTFGRSSGSRLSRNVDAVLDQPHQQDEEGVRAPLRARTLRPRGLSDSSIHTSFLQGEPQDAGTADVGGVDIPFKSQGTISPPATESVPASPPRRERGEKDRARSPVARLGRNLASWAAAAADLQDGDLLVGSPREDRDGVLSHAAWTRRGLERRDL